MQTVIRDAQPSPIAAADITNNTPAANATTTKAWTVETIYAPNAWSLYAGSMPPKLHPDLSVWELQDTYTPEYMHVLARETRWLRIGDLGTIPPSQMARVASAEAACPVCGSHTAFGGSAWVLHRGEVTGLEVMRAVPCICRAAKLYRRAWTQAMRSHKRFDGVRLHSLAPDARLSSLSLERQAAIIDKLKNNPQHSYLLYGPPNTGKTHFLTALFGHSLLQWAGSVWQRSCPEEAVSRISAAELLDQHVAWETRDKGEHAPKVALPSVTKVKIQAVASRGLRPCLFLDEVDKIAPTEFKLNRLISIVDAVYEAEGQVVATSNKSVDQLAAKWGSDEAGTILRRIGVGERAHTVYFG